MLSRPCRRTLRSGSGADGPSARAVSVAELEAEGVPAVLAAHASGELQRRHRFLFAAAPYLRVVRRLPAPVLATHVLRAVYFRACALHSPFQGSAA